MVWMEVLAPAKLNLFLELIERRNDGFHEIETIMTSVNLCDSILLRRRSDERICLTQIPVAHQKNPEVFSMPENRTNLVWRALDLLRETTGCRFGLDVAIRKNIPNQAGMGGGSSDAAAVLKAGNRLFDLGLGRARLMELAGRLGSDVPFFLGHRTARCLGRGEQIHPVSETHPLDFVIAMPPRGLSTADVYRESRIPKERYLSERLLNGLQSGSADRVGNGLRNRLQAAAESLCPWIQKLKTEFQRTECRGHQMTGSGAGYFGVFPGRRTARRAARKLAARLPACSLFCVSTVGNDANQVRYRAE